MPNDTGLNMWARDRLIDRLNLARLQICLDVAAQPRFAHARGQS
jgi:hypothetical protein